MGRKNKLDKGVSIKRSRGDWYQGCEYVQHFSFSKVEMDYIPTKKKDGLYGVSFLIQSIRARWVYKVIEEVTKNSSLWWTDC